MSRATIENIYREITLLSADDRNYLYDRIKSEFYPNTEIAAYTTNGEPLTMQQYKKRVQTGIEQCANSQKISLEELSAELGYNYADL
jgi:hypothetical protein